MAILINGRKFKISENDSIIRYWLRDEQLEKIKEGEYRFTKKHIRIAIRNAKHIMRYQKYAWYRILVKIIRIFK